MMNCDKDEKLTASLYPIMLDIQGARCVVIGGGRVAERRVAGLLAAGADVTVISPGLTRQLEHEWKAGRIRAVLAGYAPGGSDIAAAQLIFAATDDPQVNKAVEAEARLLGKLVNVSDTPAISSFQVPAVVRRGRLLLAISTQGASPAAAARLKRELEVICGAEYAPYLELLHELRLLVQQRMPDAACRHRVLAAMAEWPLLELAREGQTAAYEMLKQVVAELPACLDEQQLALIGRWLAKAAGKR